MQTIIDNSQTVIELAGRKRSAVVVLCDCGFVRPLTLWDAQKAVRNNACLHCASVRKGALGFKATADKYGEDFAINMLRKHRLENPSNLEKQIITDLNELGLSFEREYPLECGDGAIYYDFHLLNSRLEKYLVEVDGEYWHSNEVAQARDIYKNGIATEQGYYVIRIKEAEIKDAKKIIMLAIQRQAIEQ